eukprot:4365798-Pleurochrysis_carterae.AAC.1
MRGLHRHAHLALRFGALRLNRIIRAPRDHEERAACLEGMMRTLAVCSLPESNSTRVRRLFDAPMKLAYGGGGGTAFSVQASCLTLFALARRPPGVCLLSVLSRCFPSPRVLCYEAAVATLLFSNSVRHLSAPSSALAVAPTPSKAPTEAPTHLPSETHAGGSSRAHTRTQSHVRTLPHANGRATARSP